MVCRTRGKEPVVKSDVWRKIGEETVKEIYRPRHEMYGIWESQSRVRIHLSQVCRQKKGFA